MKRLLVVAVVLGLMVIYDIVLALAMVIGVSALEISRRIWDRSRVLAVLVLAGGLALTVAVLELLG